MSSPRITTPTTKRISQALAQRLSTQPVFTAITLPNSSTSTTTTPPYEGKKKVRLEEKQEQKLTIKTTLEYKFNQFYWELKILPHAQSWQENPPKKILLFDIDETLINFKQSEVLGKLVFINPEALKNLLSYIEEDIMVAAVTSRAADSLQDGENDFLSAIEVIRGVEELCGRPFFSYIFFTDGRTKSPVLDELYNRHVKSGTNPSRRTIALLDDLDLNLRDCDRAGYKTIRADYQGNHYEAALNDFLLSPIVELPEEDNSFICAETLDEDDEQSNFNFQP